ncbi:MAG TPA: DUF3306 domain-containing protein [Beijerinckiaceae bacterium]|jgi:hypothetical protein
MSGDFLSRWSRRKQEARRVERAPEVPPEEAAPPEAPVEAGGAPAEAGLTAEEIAQLPNIEELTAETDITAFLGRGVPESLRNAALRKMWTLDPAIRDFEGHARDYAYDWNIPGGVPGAGPLGSGDDVAAMVRRVFGESEPEPAPERPADQSGVEGSRDREPPASPDSDHLSVAAAQQETEGEAPGAVRSGTEPAAESPSSEAETQASPAAPLAAPQSETAAKPPPDVPSRRHGGAKPV